MTKRIYPLFLPNWFRPIYCRFRSYHFEPLYIPVNAPVGFQISCGVCGKLRVKIKDIK